jgi:hypothetical protein
MGDIDRRIERIERLLGNADCMCGDPTRRTAVIIVEDDWDSERVRLAETAIGFDCPTHGFQLPKSVARISPVDASL